MNHKKKVLIVTPRFAYGGLDFVAIRLQQALDKNKFECIYCVRSEKKDNPIESKLKGTGVRIIHQPENKAGYLSSYLYYKQLFSQEHFDVVHCHLPFYSGIVMLAAKRRGIKKRIAHSHYSSPLALIHSKPKMLAAELYRAIMRILIGTCATDIIGCSLDAGIFLCGKSAFAKKGVVLNNGIDTEVYRYNIDIRDKKRKELGIENKIVIGHIGQMYYVKNHSFLIDVFYEFQSKYPNSVLLLISDGPDREKIEKKVASLGMADKVIFLGYRDDVSELLMAMDCFVFPSIHEGFPLTLVEAQASKLPCVVSDSVTPQAKLNSNFSFVSIHESVQVWRREIENLLGKDRMKVDNTKVVHEFDIKHVAKQLEQIYLS